MFVSMKEATIAEHLASLLYCYANLNKDCTVHIDIWTSDLKL